MCTNASPNTSFQRTQVHGGCAFSFRRTRTFRYAEASPLMSRSMDILELSEIPGVVTDMEATEVINDE